MKCIKLFSLFLLLFFFTMTHRAYAYIDPGTGSYILQMAIAGIVGSLFAVKVFWNKIKLFFSGLFGKKA